MNQHVTIAGNGKLAFSEQFGTWYVFDLKPHVSMAFKRLFPKVSITETRFTLKDTDATRADLQWFLQRYPLDTEEHGRLREGAERLARKAAERERILLPSWLPGAVPGFRENRQPYLYQTQAAQITLNNPNLLLGDDVGLGKTISALATITMGAPLPAALVVQPHLAQQWADRIEEFTTLRAHIIKGTQPYDLPVADIYIFRYSNVFGWVDIFDTGMFRTFITDEIQELRKGEYTNKGRASSILKAHADVSLGLTATPIYNYGDEMFAVMGFVEPGLLGGRDEFLREWCMASGSNWIVRNPDGLGSFLHESGYYLVRDENDINVAASMPPLNLVQFEVGWDDNAVQDVNEIARVLAQKVVTGHFVERGQAARELDAFMRLQTGVAKARSVAAYVDLLLQDSERVLLAGWHRDVYDIWRAHLARHNPVLYTGTESPAKKRRNVEAFTNGDSRVMMISLRSGSGLDGLQDYCSDVVVGELDWSPQVLKQLYGRLRRPGQRGQVTAHVLHTAGGSDPIMLDVLGLKGDQSRGIIRPGEEAEERERDDTRIQRLAEAILKGGRNA